MGITGEKRRDMIRTLQHAILQLCNEYVGYNNKLQILGVLCLNIDDETREVVIKVNNTLKRVPPSGNTRDTNTHAQMPVSGSSTSGLCSGNTPKSSPQKHTSTVLPTYNASGQTSGGASNQLSGPAFIVSPGGLIPNSHSLYNSIRNLSSSISPTTRAGLVNGELQKQILLSNNNTIKESFAIPTGSAKGKETPLSLDHSSHLKTTSPLDLSPILVNKSESHSPTTGSASKKSVGRKARKPTRVDCVYDEGEMIMNEENDFMTVIPTDPDQPEEEIEMRNLTDTAKASDEKRSSTEPSDVNQSNARVHNETGSTSRDRDEKRDTASNQYSIPQVVVGRQSTPICEDEVQTTAAARDEMSSENQKAVERGDSPAPGSLMRQVLEKGAESMRPVSNTNKTNTDTKERNRISPQSKAQRSLMPTLLGTREGENLRSMDVRTLLQIQAYMRQQAKRANVSLNDDLNPNAPKTSSPHAGSFSASQDPESLIMPILVSPHSPMGGSEKGYNGANGDVNSIYGEQEEALDFSNSAEKTGGHIHDTDEEDDDEGLEVVRAIHSSTPASHSDASFIHVKDEPRDFPTGGSRPISSGSSCGMAEDLSQSMDLSASGSLINQALGSGATHYAFPRPYQLMAALPQFSTYSGLNLSMGGGSGSAIGSLLSGSDTGGLSIQYTATGPITVGTNGQNMSHQVNDLSIHGSPAKKSRKSAVNSADREGEFVLDQLAEEARKRRRKAPNDTLTAEEIAEYMGASNVPSGRDGVLTFKCKYCTEEIDDLVRYLQHTLTIHNAYICHQCGKSFTTKSSLLRHRPIHTGLRRFACSICKKSFYRKDKCKSHIKRHLGPNDQNIDQYQHIEPVPEMNDNSGL